MKAPPLDHSLGHSPPQGGISETAHCHRTVPHMVHMHLPYYSWCHESGVLLRALEPLALSVCNAGSTGLFHGMASAS